MKNIVKCLYKNINSQSNYKNIRVNIHKITKEPIKVKNGGILPLIKSAIMGLP